MYDGGLPYNQLRIHKYLPDRRLGRLKALNQHFAGGEAHLQAGLIYCGDGRYRNRSQVGIIKAYHREITRYLISAQLCAADHRSGKDIGTGKKGIRRAWWWRPPGHS